MGVLMDNVRQGFNLLFTPVFYYGVVASIALQLATWEKGDRTQDKIQDQYANQADNFDFIIVGAGTAGSVLANRLSQYYSVLLLEAGGEPHPLQFVPGLARDLVGHQQIDWAHRTVAQKKSSAFAQYRRALWSSGKSVGGSGSLDFLMYLRGNPEDFNNWARITKDSSWKYDNLLRHFQRAEDLVANSTDPGAHRHGGEMRIQKSDFLPLAKEFIAAAKELGYENVDLNGHYTQGFDGIYSTIKKGERQAPVRAFVDPMRKRTTLTIRKFAFVNKIRFRSDNTAYAVEYERHGQKYTVYATREIILSAGAIGTPKILMLSGIGPKRHLDEFGIKNIVNLPVGQNLQDHVATYLGPFFINEPLSIQKDRDITAKSYVEYGAQGTGPLTSGGFQATGFLASEFAKGRGEDKWPDLQLTLYASSVGNTFSSDMSQTHGLDAQILKNYYAHAIGKNSFHIVTSLSRPAGRGEVRLASRNPNDPLVINPKYLEDPWNLDIKAAVDGLKKAMRIVEGSTTFQDIGAHFTSQVLPGCENTKFRSDEYFECYMRHYTVSMYNPVGSCAMGPKQSMFAVVDPELKVIGTKHLRVIDASIMPSIVVGGTQAATIMIAEKGAETILDYWTHSTEKLKDDNNLDNSIEGDHSEEHRVTASSVTPTPRVVSTTPKARTPPSPLTTEVPLKTHASPTMSFLHALKNVSPFSVSIKNSSPSPSPVRMSSTAAPVTRAPSIETTTKSVARPTSSVAHVSFPIISYSKKAPQNGNRKPQPVKVNQLPKLNYFGSTKAPTLYNLSPTPSPYPRGQQVVEQQQVRTVKTTTTRPVVVTTPTPSDNAYYYDDGDVVETSTLRSSTTPSTSTFSIQKAEMNFDTDNLTATTYRPQLVYSDFDVQPQELVKSLPFGQSILYLVENKGDSNNNYRQEGQVQSVSQAQGNLNYDLEEATLGLGKLVPPSVNNYHHQKSYQYPQQQSHSQSQQSHSQSQQSHSQQSHSLSQQQKQQYQVPNSFISTNPQFEFHQELDEGYNQDRYTRGNRHLHQVEQVKVHRSNPIKILRREPSKSSFVPQVQVEEQRATPKPHPTQIPIQWEKVGEHIQRDDVVLSEQIQPASMIYQGTTQSLNNNANANSNPYYHTYQQQAINSNYRMSPLSAHVNYQQPITYSYYG